jgi:hypothetical protein
MPATYQQALTEYARFLPFTALASAPGRLLPLREVYVERALVPYGQDSPEPPTPDSSQQHSLADLVRTPGARILLIGEPGAGKTVCFHYLALDHASQEAAPIDARHELAGGASLPVLLRPLESPGMSIYRSPAHRRSRPS